MPSTLRRSLAVIATAAVVIGAVQVVGDNTTPGSAFSTMATVGADPTGPPGPTGGPGMDGGQQFQPPSIPQQQPDYQGSNQPPLNQDNGVSIYNSGAPQAPQQGGQQGAQQQPGNQQPQHGTQIPNYQTATPYTQGPGQANPDYQAPQQGPQQQPPQQGPSNAPTQQPSSPPTPTKQPGQQQWPDDKRPVDLQKGCLGPTSPDGSCKWAPRFTIDMPEEASRKLVKMATELPHVGFIASCMALGAALAYEAPIVGQGLAAVGAAIVCEAVWIAVWPNISELKAGQHIQIVVNGAEVVAKIVGGAAG
ncbi:hypothetical protein [Mycobacteroides abscessus]